MVMALIKCLECGNNVSDKANACPNCGAPPVPNAIKPDVTSRHEANGNQVNSPSSQLGRVRLTERINTSLSEAEVRAAVGAAFSAMSDRFDIETLRISSKNAKGLPPVEIAVSRVETDWLISVTHKERKPKSGFGFVFVILVLIALWVFVSGWLALGMLVITIMGMYAADQAAPFTSAQVTQCLINMKNELSVS